jgi:serine-type anaerobic sulfatase-maturating enzyme
LSFNNVIKPTHVCNLACTYCYNDDVRRPIMDEETLRRTIDQTFDYVDRHVARRSVDFIWHGGEPMVPGLRFYEKVTQYQSEFCRDIPYKNSIQTNGTLINNDWLRFFLSEQFSISISIDGPRDLHDRFRVDRRGRGSFDRVQRAIDLVREAGLTLGVCVVISRANVDHVDEIYDFVSAQRLPFNIIPLNRSGAARDNYDDVGLEADEYGPAWIRMYDRWFDAQDDYVYCSDFVLKTRAILAGRPADCVGLEQCGEENIAVDPVGDVFACATLSGSLGTCYGNIVSDDLETLMNTPVALDYRRRRTDAQCARCRWQHVCHGGCQARAYKFFGDHHHRDYYCPSLFSIYEHIAERMVDKIGGEFTPASGPEVDRDSLVPLRIDAKGKSASFSKTFQAPRAREASVSQGWARPGGGPAPQIIPISAVRRLNQHE